MLELHTLSPCGVYKPLVRPMSYWTQVAADYGKIVFILGIIDGYPTPLPRKYRASKHPFLFGPAYVSIPCYCGRQHPKLILLWL